MNTNCTFQSNAGSYQVFTVPATLLEGFVEMTCVGGDGSAAWGVGHPGGAGGQVFSRVAVNAGDQLWCYVGKQGGQTAGGWGWANGGAGQSYSGSGVSGGGGGATAVVGPQGNQGAQGVLMVGAGGGGGGSGYDPGQSGEPPDHSTGQGGYGGGSPGQGYDGKSQGAQGTPGYGALGSSGAQAGSQGGQGADAYDGSGGGGGGGQPGGAGGAQGYGGTSVSQQGGGGGRGGTSYLNPTTQAGWAYYTEGGVGTNSDGSVTISWKQADAMATPNPIQPPSLGFISNVGTQGMTFQWQANAYEDSGDQSAYCLRIQQFGGPWLYWNGSAFTSSVYWVISTSETVTIPAGKIVDGGPYVWQVATDGNDPLAPALASPWSQAQIFVTAAVPTVNVLTPAGHTAILQPTVTWEDTLTSGVQTNYQVMIYTLAETETSGFDPIGTQASALYNSGVQSGTALSQATTGVTYTTGTQYVAYVRVTQTNGATSNWASSLFTADSTTPATPGICAVDVTGAGTQAELIVWGNDNNDLPGGCQAGVQSSTDGGSTWSNVSGATALTMAMPGQMVGCLQTISYTSTTIWRARLTSPATGSPISAWAYTTGVVLGAVNSPLLGDVSKANTTIPLWISKSSATGREIEQGVFQAIGNQSEIVISDVRRLRTGDLMVVTQSNAERDAIIALCTPPRQLGLTRMKNDPNALVFSMKFTPTGVVEEDKPGHLWQVTPRVLTIHYTEQA